MLEAGYATSMPIDQMVVVWMVRDPKRSRCSQCHNRRVLYRVSVNATLTKAVCAPCWGVR